MAEEVVQLLSNGFLPSLLTGTNSGQKISILRIQPSKNDCDLADQTSLQITDLLQHSSSIHSLDTTPTHFATLAFSYHYFILLVSPCLL